MSEQRSPRVTRSHVNALQFSHSSEEDSDQEWDWKWSNQGYQSGDKESDIGDGVHALGKLSTIPRTKKTILRTSAQKPGCPRKVNPVTNESQTDVPIPSDIPNSESLTKQSKSTWAQRTKAYNYNPWDQIKRFNADITVEQLVQISPAVCTKLKEGIM